MNGLAWLPKHPGAISLIFLGTKKFKTVGYFLLCALGNTFLKSHPPVISLLSLHRFVFATPINEECHNITPFFVIKSAHSSESGLGREEKCILTRGVILVFIGPSQEGTSSLARTILRENQANLESPPASLHKPLLNI